MTRPARQSISARLSPAGITKYDVHLPGLPAAQDGMVVAVATDMHVGKTIGAKWLSRHVDQIQALRPDLIIIAGNIFEVLAAIAAAEGL